MWYHERIGGGRCPIVDTWWQTETGAIMISPLPGRHDHEARARRRCRCPASRPTVVDEQGNEVPRGGGGYLVLKRPWPAMLRTLWGDDERYGRPTGAASAATRTSPATAPTRRGRRLLADGPGRRRDQRRRPPASRRPRSSRPRVSTRRSPRRPRSAPTTRSRARGSRALRDHSRRRRADRGAAARAVASTSRRRSASSPGPACCCSRRDLPKTRSGKIMRRLLKDVAEGREIGDATTLRDPSIVQSIKEQADQQLGR